jgi:acyl-CoA thioesterase-2
MMSDTETGVDDPLELLTVEEDGPGTFTGMSLEGKYGRAFGGSVLAHALRAATRAVGDVRAVESIHASFVSPADPSVPVTYRTEVIKSGRALDVAGVRAVQGDRTVFYGFVTCHDAEATIEFGDRAPDVPSPDDLDSTHFVPRGTNGGVRSPFDRRPVPLPPGARRAREDHWIRSHAPVHSDNPNDHAALLAYASDFLVSRAAHAGMPGEAIVIGASLDHAMWFHRPFRIDDWLLISSTASIYTGSRSLSTSQIFDRSGALVATATQEALIRATDLPA